MKRSVEKTRQLLHRLAREVVRGYAAAAMLASGFVGAAALLEEETRNEDAEDAEMSADDELGRMRRSIHRATTFVLDRPHSADSERALVVLFAAEEAVAMANAADPTEAHVQQLLRTAAVAAEVADRPRNERLRERLRET